MPQNQRMDSNNDSEEVFRGDKLTGAPIAHQLCALILMSEWLYFVILSSSPTNLFTFLSRIITALCSAVCAVSYLFTESGYTTLSIIEPVHSIAATGIWFNVFRLKHCYMRQNRSDLVRWAFARARFRENLVVKLLKLLLLSSPTLCSLYVCYVALRQSRYAVLFYSSPIQRFLGVFLFTAALSRGGLHTILALLMLVSTLVSMAIRKYYLNLLDRGGMNLGRGPLDGIREMDADPKQSYFSMEGVVTIVFLLCELWDDSFTAHVDIGGGVHAYHTETRQGTETRCTWLLASWIDQRLGLRPCRRHSAHVKWMENKISLGEITLHRLFRLAMGIRDIGDEAQRERGVIWKLANECTAIDDRLEAATLLVMQIKQGAALSYRHSATMKESCEKIESLVDGSDIQVLWADVFLKEIKEVSPEGMKWISVGLEPYLCLDVLREVDIPDGDGRLWLALEVRLPYSLILGHTERKVGHLMLLATYYYTGKILNLRAFCKSDVIDAAKLGCVHYITLFFGKKATEGYDEHVRLELSLALLTGILDGYATEYANCTWRVEFVEQDELEHMRNMLCDCRNFYRSEQYPLSRRPFFKAAKNGDDLTIVSNLLPLTRPGIVEVVNFGESIVFRSSLMLVAYTLDTNHDPNRRQTKWE